MGTGSLVAKAVLAAALAIPAAGVFGQGVYVAGQGFTLEQALEQALREQRSGNPFWIVAAGDEAVRVVQAEGEHVGTLLEQVREHGGAVYACENDLANGAVEEQLPDSVGLVRPPEKPGEVVVPPEAEVQAIPEANRQSRLILRTCEALQVTQAHNTR